MPTQPFRYCLAVTKYTIFFINEKSCILTYEFFWEFTQHRLVVCYGRFGTTHGASSSTVKQSKKNVGNTNMLICIGNGAGTDWFSTEHDASQ